VPHPTVVPLPEGSHSSTPHSSEPLAVAVHDVRRSRLIQGETAVVIGGGLSASSSRSWPALQAPRLSGGADGDRAFAVNGARSSWIPSRATSPPSSKSHRGAEPTSFEVALHSRYRA
jgi:hypothetical protein